MKDAKPSIRGAIAGVRDGGLSCRSMFGGNPASKRGKSLKHDQKTVSHVVMHDAFVAACAGEEVVAMSIKDLLVRAERADCASFPWE